ncbi:hypothetical protein ON064_04140 [Planococcus sp. A6]|uniref:hypothetical protein n=1 Tax=Planococcus sp. A6 TaxID=2992760 RepID=UPI00237B87F3|nr:hypothetical protein [Planococcus sp. A6]MDE0582236.1 hypothetical protein [Planococcus sp. A6]
MNFPIYKSFKDKQDQKRLNEKNKFYPREGLEPTEERVKELQDKGYIGDKVVEESDETDVVEYPVHKGGGNYLLSNGESVKGKEDAQKAEDALKSGE